MSKMREVRTYKIEDGKQVRIIAKPRSTKAHVKRAPTPAPIHTDYMASLFSVQPLDLAAEYELCNKIAATFKGN